MLFLIVLCKTITGNFTKVVFKQKNKLVMVTDYICDIYIIYYKDIFNLNFSLFKYIIYIQNTVDLFSIEFITMNMIVLQIINIFKK